MIETKERIKEVRKAHGLTQTEFGKKVGVKGNTITCYEKGIREPSNAIIRAIAREFGVDERWLLTGEGEMFRPVSRDAELAAFFEDLQGSTPDFRHQLVSVLSRLSVDEWAMLERKAKELLAEMQKDSP